MLMYDWQSDIDIGTKFPKMYKFINLFSNNNIVQSFSQSNNLWTYVVEDVL